MAVRADTSDKTDPGFIAIFLSSQVLAPVLLAWIALLWATGGSAAGVCVAGWEPASAALVAAFLSGALALWAWLLYRAFPFRGDFAAQLVAPGVGMALTLTLRAGVWWPATLLLGPAMAALLLVPLLVVAEGFGTLPPE